jgi:hypothetical protein
MYCIQNNWLNQKDQEKTFVYPDFDNFQKLCFARFSILWDIYEKEKQLLIKTTLKLNFKTVYPSSLERQKVILALNVWHKSTIAVVKKHTSDERNETAAFLEIIWKWWGIMDIQNQFTHILKQNDVERPFTSIEDEQIVFLKKFLEWLSHWNPVLKNGEFLTKETHSALYCQTAVMVQFIEYSLIDLKIPYVLPGKIQTDILKKRFGCY